MKTPTIKQLEKYLEYPVKCALCGSDNLESDPPDFNSATEIGVHTKCLDCGAELDEAYIIHKVWCGTTMVGRGV